MDRENERKLKIRDSFAFGYVLVIKYPFLGVHFFRIYTQTLTVWNDFHNSLTSFSCTGFPVFLPFFSYKRGKFSELSRGGLQVSSMEV